MSGYLRSQRIRIFDYPEFAQGLREQIRSNAEALAQTHGIEIEYVHKKNFRKEERVQAIAGGAWQPARAGAYLLSDGTLQRIQTLA